MKINLNNNNLNLIPENTFAAARAIQKVNLGKNKISILDSRSFGSLNMLTELSVRDNLIDEVDYSLISQSSILTIVDFSSNICTELRTDSFNERRNDNMDAMKDCFDKFDSNPIGEYLFDVSKCCLTVF